MLRLFQSQQGMQSALASNKTYGLDLLQIAFMFGHLRFQGRLALEIGEPTP